MSNIRDIARQAGVSVATVSHVLNQTRYVHPDTAERVMKVVQELDYKPNMLARSLRRKRTRTIGLLVTDIDSPYFTELTHSVDAVTSQRGYNVILCNTGESLEKEELHVDMLLAKQVDGLIVVPAPGDHSYLQAHLERGARIVFVNRFLRDVRVPAVTADDEEASYLLANRLLERGHRRIGAASWVEGASTYEARWAGFRRALEEHGLSMADSWIYRGQAGTQDGRRAAAQLASQPTPPTAVIAFNSIIRDAILMELLAVAPHLLQQVEIAGFGYSPVAHVFRSSPYYIAQPSQEIGRLAATLLLDVLDGQASWNPDERILLKTRLAYFEPGGEVVFVRWADGPATAQV